MATDSNLFPNDSGRPALAPGLRLGDGRYTLVRVLGRGGMGVVWLAEDARLKEQVALKFLPPEIPGDPVALDDMRRETARSRKLSHPHIIRIHDFFEGEGEAFVSMEFVDGPNLAALRLQQEQRIFHWDFLVPIITQLCQALDYAHNERIIHRDLKPANMMLDSKGRLKLADFGIAAVVDEAAGRISVKHSTSGTPGYMSPQQLDGQIPRVTDDIYALGATLYELLTGKPPFYSGDIPHQVRTLPAAPIQDRLEEFELQNEVPPAVAALIMACLSKNPEQRSQSARAIAEWIGLETDGLVASASESLLAPTENIEEAAMAITCKFCGQSNSVTAIYCSGCGHEIKHRRAMYKIILVAVAVVALAYVAFYLIVQKVSKKDKQQPEAGIAITGTNETNPTVNPSKMPANFPKTVLYFNFDDSSHGKVVIDQSGFGHDGKIVGAQWTNEGHHGAGMNFLPNNCFVSVPSQALMNLSELTLAVWIKTSRADHFYRRIFEKSYRTGFALSIVGDWEKWVPATKNRGKLTFEMGGKGVDSDQSVADGQWHHVAATYDGKIMRLYVDGQPQTRTLQRAGILPPNNFDLHLGGFVDPDLAHDDPTASFDGTMDDVMIFDHALSAAEIWQIFEAR